MSQRRFLFSQILFLFPFKEGLCICETCKVFNFRFSLWLNREIGDDGKELMFDHGAPFFCVSNSDAMALVHEWESRGFVSEWKQVFGSFDCASNKFLGIQQVFSHLDFCFFEIFSRL